MLNFNSLLPVKVDVSANTSYNIFTLFPCHIVFVSVHIEIYKFADSFHSYSTIKGKFKLSKYILDFSTVLHADRHSTDLDRHGRDCIVVGITTTYAIGAHYH